MRVAFQRWADGVLVCQCATLRIQAGLAKQRRCFGEADGRMDVAPPE
jgi:hypothetical protein